MSGPKPTRDQGDLAEMLETLLDKGMVINADIAVNVGDTELLSVHVRAAIASFETAAAYGLDFPSGTDMDRVEEAAGIDPLPAGDGDANGGESPESDAADDVLPGNSPDTPPIGEEEPN